MSTPITITVEGSGNISGLFDAAPRARACYVLAHGAGAGMTHAFMVEVAAGLSARGIATLRYQFPYMERGLGRPDSPKVAQGAVRAAVEAAGRLVPDLPLVAGGKSFGGRMTSQAQAAAPLPRVRGLVFLGFPLHAAGRPSVERAKHLNEIEIPMLFVQGTRDALADSELIRSVTGQLGSRATLHLIPQADHSFHVPVRSGRTDTEVRDEFLDVFSNWVSEVVAVG